MISIYIHWPFCKSKCPYCDFNSHVAKELNEDSWLRAYKAELDSQLHTFKGKKIRSIFFGGGTPSLMPPHISAFILEYIAKYADLSPDTEITLEANPTSSESKSFKAFRDAGVNRLSIGVQSFDEKRLQFLGREHNLTESLKAIELASKLFPRFSFDMIYATPHQTLDTWKNELKQAINFAADHISLYQLTIEKGTKFYTQHLRGEFEMPNSDLADDLYEVTEDILSPYGLEMYEVSNYAKKGFESQHNLSYWRYQDYIGIGPGAHSRIADHDKMKAFCMIHNPNAWLKANLEGESAMQNSSILTEEELLTEILMMGLRLKDGIDHSNLQKFFGKNFDELIRPEYIKMLVDNNLLSYDTNNIKLTKSGLKLHQAIMRDMITLE